MYEPTAFIQILHEICKKTNSTEEMDNELRQIYGDDIEYSHIWGRIHK